MNKILCSSVVFILALLGAEVAAADKVVQVCLSGKIDGKSNVTFDVSGLDPAALARLSKASLEPSQLTALFAVSVLSDRSTDSKSRPSLLGSHRVEDGVLRFEPRFPLVVGVRYQAVFDPSRLPGQTGGKPVVAEFGVPKPPRAPTTVVQHVYPSRDKLPENQLKFYLHFSAPLSRGEAYEHLRLLDAQGKQVDRPFLELGEELWDPQGKRFTLLLDPGRIKRGLKPREEFGPVLEEGKTYTLVIDRRWTDADGNPLKETYRKKFSVLAPADESPDPKTWKLQAPAAGKTGPLTLTFPKPLDHALLHRLLWVTDAAGKTVAGTVTVTDEETRWHFTPRQPWQAGDFHVVADKTLEDLAGNSIARPFEVDVLRPIQREIKTETIKLPFQVRANGSERTKEDLAAFKSYLEKKAAEKKWQTGPARIDSDEVRKSYEKRRFYYVFSAPPLPPGANTPEVQKAYQQRLEEFRKNYISLTVSIDDQGKIALADYNQGLMKIKTDEDAQTAAAAILSLHASERVGPGPVAAKDVTVTKSEKGWSCRVVKRNAYQGSVTFDAAGKYTGVSKIYAGPLPP